MTKFATEHDLENFICEHPNVLNPVQSSVFDYKIIGRQVKLPHGILDLLVLCQYEGYPKHILVVELKNGPISDSAISQVMRYCYDVRMIVNRAVEQLPFDYDSCGRNEFDMMRQCESIELPDKLVRPVLVGTYIAANLLEACGAAGIDALTYNIADDTVRISFVFRELIGKRWYAEDERPGWVNDIMDTLIFVASRNAAEKMDEKYGPAAVKSSLQRLVCN